MTTSLFIVGCGLFVAGVAMLSIPAALIAAGVLAALFAVGVEAGRSRES